MAPSPVAERLARLLHPVVSGAGLVVESVSVSTVGRRRVVRVVVDLPDDELGSADLDRVAEASRLAGEALDGPAGEAAVGPGAYALEVTTPGVDRPLTERRHWLRARTRLVRASLVDGGEATGRLVAVDDDGVTLDEAAAPRTGRPAGGKGGRANGSAGLRHLAWTDVGKGRIEIEFRRDDDAGEEPDGPGADDGPDERDDA